jgi:TonB family protein
MRTLTSALISLALLTAASAQEIRQSSTGLKARTTYAPRPIVPAEARARGLKGAGVCVVYLRPDGTVERAEMNPSTGEPLLDKASIEAFSRWKFATPVTVKKLKIPIRYTGKYPEPSNT